MSKSQTDLPVITFASESEFEAWLEDNFRDPGGLWIKIAKKASGIESVTHQEALDVALCHGWIDGQRKRYDDMYFLQRFTPRRKRSKWSQVNRDKVTRLIEAGRMRPAGMAEIDAAKADGRWDAAYASQSTMTVPDDLAEWLDQHPNANTHFQSLDSRNRYAILYRLQEAKRPETRARRLEQFKTMLVSGEKIY